MPAHRSRMLFEPLPPILDLNEVVASSPNFEFAMRVTCDAIDKWPLEDFERLVLYQVVLCGKPLVIEGFQKHLDSRIFSEKWLRESYKSKSKLFLRTYAFFRLVLTIVSAGSRRGSRSGSQGERFNVHGTLPF
jgi:hypothetical protein